MGFDEWEEMKEQAAVTIRLFLPDAVVVRVMRLRTPKEI
jgi:hypothetical protein